MGRSAGSAFSPLADITSPADPDSANVNYASRADWADELEGTRTSPHYPLYNLRHAPLRAYTGKSPLSIITKNHDMLFTADPPRKYYSTILHIKGTHEGILFRSNHVGLHSLGVSTTSRRILFTCSGYLLSVPCDTIFKFQIHLDPQILHEHNPIVALRRPHFLP